MIESCQNRGRLMQTGYYKLIKQLKGIDREIGELFYLSEISDSEVELIQYTTTWTLSVKNFEECFEFAPEGVKMRQEQMTSVINSFHQIGNNQDHLIQIASVVPCITGPEVEDSKDVGSSLATTGNNSPAVLSQNIKIVKSQMTYTRQTIARKQQELSMLVKEQEMILRSKTDALMKQVSVAMEAIYMINTYLGKDEELVRIKDGEPAPVDTKITIRQLVLFMDEESAAANGWAERGGMDFGDVESFDKWVKDPKNLALVLPEKKGIVAIKPRRNDKYYSDNAFENAELNRLNKCLYLLVRNGDILYRIHTTLWLEKVLFPKKDEFDKFFYERSYDDSVKKPLRPGSKQYMEAMERSEKHQRRYYTVLLLIQGIIDRTKVLHPIPEERINMCDFAASEKYFTFLRDAEGLLSDGRPDFDTWLKSVNSKLKVGHRVVGNWVSDRRDRDRYEPIRVTPRTASSPSWDGIYTIEKDSGNARNSELNFYYERTGEIIYKDWRSPGVEPSRRAKYSLYRYDDFFVDFDEVKVDDIQYYISCRLHRHEYMGMIPLLNSVMKMKIEEQKVEKPFSKLLIGEIIKEHNVSISCAEEFIYDLIPWWKLKNKTHRALTVDDSKAIRMIVSEFGRRLELKKQQSKFVDDQNKFVKSETSKNDNVLAIFHRKDNEYVCFYWCNDRNVFVTEKHYNYFPDCIDCVYEKTDKTVDKRYESWKLIWSHERWNDWNVNAYENSYLTDSEYELAVEYGLSKIKTIDHYSRCKDAEDWLVPLAIHRLKDDSVSVYYAGKHALIPEKNFITEHAYEPSLGVIYVDWEKKGGKISFRKGKCNSLCIDAEQCWLNKSKNIDPFRFKSNFENESITKIFEENIQAFVAEDKKFEEFKKKKHDALVLVYEFIREMNNVLLEKWYEKEHVKFLEEYVDPDGSIWEMYKKDDLKKPYDMDYKASWLQRACGHLIENQIELYGMTVEEILQKSSEFGYKLEDEPHANYEAIKHCKFEVREEDEQDD